MCHTPSSTSIEGPSWLKIREYDGYLSGNPNKTDIGPNRFIISLKNQKEEYDILELLIEVEEGV